MSTVARYDVPLIVGKAVYGDTGLGVLGSAIPSTGTNGPSFLYADLSLPADAGKQIRGLIVSPPSSGTFFAYEDGSFIYTGPTSSFVYREFADGADLGTATVTLNLGTTPVISDVGGIPSVAAVGMPDITAIFPGGPDVISDVGGIPSVAAVGMPIVSATFPITDLGRSRVRIVYGSTAASCCGGPDEARGPTQLLPKDVHEIDDVPFVFGDSLDVDETIVGQSVIPTTYSGDDPNPENFIAAVQRDGTDVIVRITGGVAGCAYHLHCQITTNLGRVIVAAAIIWVLEL